jgi:hypothetical protein
MAKYYRCSLLQTQSDFRRALGQLGLNPKLVTSEYGLHFRDVRNAYFQFDEEMSIPPIERGIYYLTERFLSVTPEKIEVVMLPAIYLHQQFYLDVSHEGVS